MPGWAKSPDVGVKMINARAETVHEKASFRRPFAARRCLLPAAWSQRFYAWNDSTDLRKNPETFDALLRGAPIVTRRASRLDYEWYRPVISGLPLERWALEATAMIALPPGEYTVRTISDDGVQVWVDGALVIDNWAPHESMVDTAPVGGGRHELKIRYYQVGGWTELRLEILRRSSP